LTELEDSYSKYRISDALMTTYKLVWDDFCSWLLEMIKPAYGNPIDGKTYNEVIAMLEENLKVLHPFVPFISEEIWQQLAERTTDEALIITSWPEVNEVNENLIQGFEMASEVISGIRTIRKEKNIAFKEPIEMMVLNAQNNSADFDSVIAKMGNLSTLAYVEEKVDGALSFRVKSNEYFIPISGAINVEEEIKKLTEELTYTEGFLKKCEKNY